MEIPLSYCPAPWRSLGSSSGRVAPCCWWKNEILESTVDYNNQADILHSTTFENIRKRMLNGEIIPNCEQCDNNRKIGLTSERDNLLAEYGFVTNVQLTEIKISFDNICNLKCRGCVSGNSHLWMSDEIKLYGKSFVDKKYNYNDIYKNIDFKNIRKVHFDGGEPFLSKRCEDFLIKLYNEGNIKNLNLSCITNCNVIPSDNVLKVLNECKSLEFSISIDGFNDLNDYFRSGSNFKKLENNLNYFYDLFKEKTNTRLGAITAVSVYNINKLKEIENFLKAYPKIEWVIKPLEYPSHMCIKNIPNELKNIIRPIIIDYGNNYKHLLNLLDMPGEDLFGHFINFHEGLNNIRNETLGDKNQLLEDFIYQYKKQNTPVDSKDFFLQQMDMLTSDDL
jgi:organic radical activating enzyme